MTSHERSQMDARVHARLVATALDCGLRPDEALRYADGRMKSIEGDGIRLDLALSDLRSSFLDSWPGRALERAVSALAAALDRVADRRRP